MPFTPPAASAHLCQGVPFDKAANIAAENKAAFDDFDQTNAARSDPSNCKALLSLPDGTIFWSSKMAIDADGPAVDEAHRSGSQMDPASGQDDTSYHYPDTGKALASEAVPYIVLPGGTFRKNTSLSLGDIAVVIYKDKLTAAICGDIGPMKKIGEASIRVHEDLFPRAPDPCSLRDAQGFCRRILNASIEEDVLFFAFPDSSIDVGLSQATVESLVRQKALTLFNTLRGLDATGQRG